MIAGGMAIGSHTHSHHVLSQLEPEQQRRELAQSRTILREQLGIEADTIAYPVGHATSFSDQTQQLVREVGYRTAFSFHGGTNLPGMARRYDVKRVGVGDQAGLGSEFRQPSVESPETTGLDREGHLFGSQTRIVARLRRIVQALGGSIL
jgi:peptidoglycan/xylan/chitin deacetylase (PgdA/CDA1 family)